MENKRIMNPNSVATQFQKGHKGYKAMLGKRRSPESIKKQSDKMKQDYKEGKRKGFEKGHSVPQEWIDKIRKANYKGGNSRNHHCGLIYKKWRTSVFERDDYTCQECGRRNVEGLNLYLEAHHKFSWKVFSEFRYKLWNGITICRECHKKITSQQKSCKHNHKEKYQVCGECGKITEFVNLGN